MFLFQVGLTGFTEFDPLVEFHVTVWAMTFLAFHMLVLFLGQGIHRLDAF